MQRWRRVSVVDDRRWFVLMVRSHVDDVRSDRGVLVSTR